MKRIAFIADSHFDIDSRWDECVRIHDWIADDIDARGADLTVHCGDIFERRSTVEERNAVARWLVRCAKRRAVTLVRGNHDFFGVDGQSDLAIFQRLRGEQPIFVEDAASVHIVNGIAIATLAWPRKSNMKALLKEGSIEQIDVAAQEALCNVIRGLGSEMAEHAGPKVFACHAMVKGSVTDNSQPIVGSEMELSLADLSLARADIIVCGHVHAQQEWTYGGVPVLYPGAPRHCNFGEPGKKGYVIATFADDGKVTYERIATPCTPMRLIDGAWQDTGICGRYSTAIPGLALTGIDGAPFEGRDYLRAEDLRGAEVRLRYQVPSEFRDAARAAAARARDTMIEDGAISVKIEERVLTTSRARTPEITTAESIEQKLEVLWTAKGTTPDNDRKEKIFAKVHELEGEAA